MAYIAQTLRREVTERARGRCEYCLTALAVVVEMEIDHVVPEAAGGATNADNLCLTCVGCNGFKLAFQTGIDPETGEHVPLFNPRAERWEDHFGWSEDGTLVLGLTPVGRRSAVGVRYDQARPPMRWPTAAPTNRRAACRYRAPLVARP